MPAPEIATIDPSTSTGRAVPEWVGATADTPVPTRVRARILLRYGGRCYKTGHKFRPGDEIQYDHILALTNGGQNRETNIAPILGGKVHDAKSATDRKEKAHTDRMRLKHLGQFPPSKSKIKGRGFERRWENR